MYLVTPSDIQKMTEDEKYIFEDYCKKINSYLKHNRLTREKYFSIIDDEGIFPESVLTAIDYEYMKAGWIVEIKREDLLKLKRITIYFKRDSRFIINKIKSKKY